MIEVVFQEPEMSIIEVTIISCLKIGNLEFN